MERFRHPSYLMIEILIPILAYAGCRIHLSWIGEDRVPAITLTRLGSAGASAPVCSQFNVIWRAFVAPWEASRDRGGAAGWFGPAIVTRYREFRPGQAQVTISKAEGGPDVDGKHYVYAGGIPRESRRRGGAGARSTATIASVRQRK